MIDWARVFELRQEIGAEDFDEVVELFLEEVEEVIARLREQTSRSSLEQDLHFLKGSALNLGFSAFSTLCQHGELLAAQGEASDVDVPKILESYDQSRSTFVEELPQKTAA